MAISVIGADAGFGRFTILPMVNPAKTKPMAITKFKYFFFMFFSDLIFLQKRASMPTSAT
jgi:hypothetical protein